MFIFLRMDLNIQLPKMSSCSPFTCFSWPWAICQMITSPSPRQANPRFSIIDHLISFHILGHSSHSVAFGQLQCGFAEKELQSHGNPNYSPQKVEHQKGGLNKALLRGNGGYIIAIYCWTLNSGWGIFAQVVRIPMTKTCKNALRDLTSGQKYLMVSPASLNPLGTPQRQNARSAHPDDKKNAKEEGEVLQVTNLIGWTDSGCIASGSEFFDASWVFIAYSLQICTKLVNLVPSDSFWVALQFKQRAIPISSLLGKVRDVVGCKTDFRQVVCMQIYAGTYKICDLQYP